MLKFSNKAVSTTLPSGATAGATTLTVGSTTDWPTPAAGQKAKGVIDRGLPTVEVFSYTGKTATTFTGVERGLDGTTAQSHTAAAVVTHDASAREFEKLAEVWESVKDFGAVGDGSNDDTAEIQAAIDAANSNGGGVVFFPKGTYKVTPSLVLYSNITLLGSPGAVIDASTMTTGQIAITVTGSEGTANNLTANASEGNAFVDIASTTGYAVGDYVIVRSNATTGSTAQTKAEIRQVRSLTATRITLMAPLADSYATADTARVAKLTLISNVRLENLALQGPASDATDVSGIVVQYAQNFTISGCRFTRFQRRCVDLQYVTQFRVSDSFFSAGRENSVPVVYGVAVIHASNDGSVDNCNFVRIRHGVVIGGSPPRRITVTGCTASQMLDAGFDCHPGGEDIVFSGNTVEGSDVDGIIFQGHRGVISNNTVRNVGRHGVLIQQLSVRPFDVIVEGNVIKRCTERGINFDFDASYSSFDSVIIANNSVEAATVYGISARNIQAYRGKGPTVIGNRVRNSGSHDVYFEKLERLVFQGNVVERAVSGSRSVRLIDILDSTVSGNVVKSVTGSTANIGFEMTGCIDVEVTGNRCITCERGIFIDATSNNCVVMGNNLRGCTTPLTMGAGAGHISTTADATGAYNRT